MLVVTRRSGFASCFYRLRRRRRRRRRRFEKMQQAPHRYDSRKEAASSKQRQGAGGGNKLKQELGVSAGNFCLLLPAAFSFSFLFFFFRCMRFATKLQNFAETDIRKISYHSRAHQKCGSHFCRSTHENNNDDEKMVRLSE